MGGHQRPLPGPGTLSAAGADHSAPPRQMRGVLQRGRRLCASSRPAGRSRKTRSTTRMDKDHGEAAQENACGLPHLLRHHPLGPAEPVQAVDHWRAECSETGTFGSEGGCAEKDLPIAGTSPRSLPCGPGQAQDGGSDQAAPDGPVSRAARLGWVARTRAGRVAEASCRQVAGEPPVSAGRRRLSPGWR
jgi:hypothetical protein